MRGWKILAAVWFATCFASYPTFVLGQQPSTPLKWEIERNFRYFLYPSEMAVQRVARDIFIAQHNNHAPTPREMEGLLNGEPGFWSTKLKEAGNQRANWPIDWPRDDSSTVYDFVKLMREKGRVPLKAVLCAPEQIRSGRCTDELLRDELSRLGWASLLARGPDAAKPMGSTDTCWDPRTRLHTQCGRWGDYVRPPGWIVRVYDPTAAAGPKCHWALEAAVVADVNTTNNFRAQTQAALRGEKSTVDADCREIRLVVASDPADQNFVKARGASVTRASPDGQEKTDPLPLDPQDRLVIGMGDSFTSGEGNPERPARFNGRSWPAGNASGASSLPARDPDSTSPNRPDTRAQWTDRWCHRSVYSWQIRSALDAALQDPHKSVTILPYGCSGAAILEGLLYGWNGPEYDQGWDSRNHVVIGSRAEIGLAYQELCLKWAQPKRLPIPPPESGPNFHGTALRQIHWYTARCSPTGTNLVKRSADALLLDIGINDVEFYRWVLGLILDDGTQSSAGGFVPCVTDALKPCSNNPKTAQEFDTLAHRFDLLREVMASLLREFHIEPGHVVAAVYPPELSGCGAADGESVSGNVGITVATQDLFPPWSLLANDKACENAGLLGILAGHGGVIAAVRHADAVKSIENARELLNQQLGEFTSNQLRGELLTKFESDFRRRGFCKSDPPTVPPDGQQCFTANDLFNLKCDTSPESMHIPKAGSLKDNSCDPRDTSYFHPFPPYRYEPYRQRTRLFRTMNDVYMTINQRPLGTSDIAFGPLDLTTRAAQGAFHPTAEAHAIVATYAAPVLCAAIGCGQ